MSNIQFVASPNIGNVPVVPGHIQSIERAASILDLVARAPYGVGVSELAAALGLAKPTTHGILRTLVHVGFVDQDDRTARYRLGAAAHRLGERRIDASLVRSHAMNWADTLAARSGEAVRIAVLDHTEVLVAHHVFRPDNSPQTLDVDARLPLHATALGKVLLAYTPGLLEQISGAGLTAYTRRTVTSMRTLVAEVAHCRAQGWACAIGEFVPDRAGLAAPLRDTGGRMVGAIGITTDGDRIGSRPDPALRALVQECAQAVSRGLPRMG